MLSFQINIDAMQALCDKGFDQKFGACRLKRVIQHKLENPIATRILRGDHKSGNLI
ncbi:MAG: hypothetical protein HOH93_05605 [Phycisphaerae bacterium]|nr:hypothetical protein [Phycisphaerae bacterium]MBT6165369.1 hypothetical protein [Phycisphaerae bacterium]